MKIGLPCEGIPTIYRLSFYLYNGTLHTGNKAFLYWNGLHIPNLYILRLGIWRSKRWKFPLQVVSPFQVAIFNKDSFKIVPGGSGRHSLIVSRQNSLCNRNSLDPVRVLSSWRALQWIIECFIFLQYLLHFYFIEANCTYLQFLTRKTSPTIFLLK